MSFQDNAARRRYELDEGHGVVHADYRDGADGLRALIHFETPPEARGRGAAGRLMEHIVTEARSSGRQLQARCPYALDYLEKHPAVQDVLGK